MLRKGDAEAFYALRQEALLASPLSFASSPDDDVAANADSVRVQLEQAPESVVFGAFEDRLVGSVGLYRDRHLKASHKAHLWGMYVTPELRRRSIGAELLRAAVAHAESMRGVDWVHLGVSVTAPGAQRLYESAGFRSWGTEADALRHAGRSAAEVYMALRLGGGG